MAPAPRRIAIVGSSGAGKTWLAGRLAAALDLDHVELDALHHGPGWTAATPAEMEAAITARCRPDGGWVADGNYEAKGGSLVRARADTVVWLDLERGPVMAQLVGRTLRRLATRETLWNGNRESLAKLLSPDPQRSVILWSFTQHRPLRARYRAQMDDRWVRLTSRAEVRRFLAAVIAASRTEPGPVP